MTTKKKSGPKKGATKGKVTGYGLFTKHRTAELKKTTDGPVIEEVRDEWKEMGEAEKKKWLDKATKENNKKE